MNPIPLVLKRIGLMLAMFATTAVFAASAPDVAAAFDVANKLYDQGKFIEAAAAYQKLSDAGSASPAARGIRVSSASGRAPFSAKAVSRTALAPIADVESGDGAAA